jgi:hypothetical protein
MIGQLDIATLLARAVVLLIAFTIHELAHAVTADYLGDRTPRSQGRISLNPIVHLDPLGTIMLLVTGFGWAKPVMVNPYQMRGDPRIIDGDCGRGRTHFQYCDGGGCGRPHAAFYGAGDAGWRHYSFPILSVGPIRFYQPDSGLF